MESLVTTDLDFRVVKCRVKLVFSLRSQNLFLKNFNNRDKVTKGNLHALLSVIIRQSKAHKNFYQLTILKACWTKDTIKEYNIQATDNQDKGAHIYLLVSHQHTIFRNPKMTILIYSDCCNDG